MSLYYKIRDRNNRKILFGLLAFVAASVLVLPPLLFLYIPLLLIGGATYIGTLIYGFIKLENMTISKMNGDPSLSDAPEAADYLPVSYNTIKNVRARKLKEIEENMRKNFSLKALREYDPSDPDIIEIKGRLFLEKLDEKNKKYL